MSKYSDAPRGFDYKPHLKNAFDLIRHYTAIFIFEDQRTASGIFVDTCGTRGILTAHHVVTELFKSETFGLCVGDDQLHGLWVSRQDFEHLPVGPAPKNSSSEMGPDLSFLIIRSPTLPGTIEIKRSFCFLESQKIDYFETPLERNFWALSGSPFESLKQIKDRNEPGGPIAGIGHKVLQATFQSRSEENGFDYIRVAVPCDQKPYPSNYVGMSGGGLWIVPLEVDDFADMSTVSHGAPLLAGVIFYQSAPRNSERIITCHGYDSVYGRVRNALQQLIG